MARIIAAEDNPATKMFYEAVLDFLGHDYVVCSDGKEVVEAFKEKKADLLLLDYHMPKMDGFEVCRRIRSMPSGVSVPIIIISAIQDEETILAGMDAGATDYLLKPVTEAHLIAKLKTYLKTASLHQRDFQLVKNQTLFAGRYRISKLLGYGNNSVVFLAEDEQDNNKKKNVAIKLLHETAETEQLAPLFMGIANRLKEVESDNVLKIYDSGQFGGRLYLVMEFAAGKDLNTLLKSRCLSDLETARLVRDILRGLKALDGNGLLHFDVKPENIMISDGNYKLGDFGITPRTRPGTKPMLKGQLWTTIAYLAPEYLDADAKELQKNIKSDLYSLGVTAYRAFTGDNPFDSDNLSVAISRQIYWNPTPLAELCPGLLSLFSESVGRMLMKDPDGRPTLEELQHAFDDLIQMIEGRGEVFLHPPVERTAEQWAEETAAKGEGAEHTATRTWVGSRGTATTHGIKTKKYFAPASKARRRAGIPLAASLQAWIAEIREAAQQSGVQIGIVLLLVIASPLIGLGAYKVLFKGDAEEGGAFYVAQCKACGHFEERRILDIRNTVCSACGKKELNYAMRCRDCGATFPFRSELPEGVEAKTRDEVVNLLKDANRCPGCGSGKIEPVYTNIEMLEELKPK